jgi:hypothetical protein
VKKKNGQRKKRNGKMRKNKNQNEQIRFSLSIPIIALIWQTRKNQQTFNERLEELLKEGLNNAH